MQRKIDRFSQYLKYKGITENKATVECGLSVGLIGQAKRGKCDLGDKAVEKIVKKYQDLSRIWLLTGEGSMLNESAKNMESSVKERLIKFLDAGNISKSEFGRRIGVSPAFITSMRKSMQPDKAKRIALEFPELNITWLLTGEGSMLKESKKNAQALASVDGEVERVIKISPQNDNTTFKSSEDMEINQLLAAILQHGADLRAQNEELRKQGERLDRILALTSPTPAAVFVPSSQETERNSPPRTRDRRVSEL